MELKGVQSNRLSNRIALSITPKRLHLKLQSSIGS